jgi:hypothetical protein
MEREKGRQRERESWKDSDLRERERKADRQTERESWEDSDLCPSRTDL